MLLGFGPVAAAPVAGFDWPAATFISATTAVVEQNDTSTAAASDRIKGATSVTEANDVATATGAGPAPPARLAQFTGVEANDVATAVARDRVKGSTTAVEQNDIAVAYVLTVNALRVYDNADDFNTQNYASNYPSARNGPYSTLFSGGSFSYIGQSFQGDYYVINSFFSFVAPAISLPVVSASLNLNVTNLRAWSGRTVEVRRWDWSTQSPWSANDILINALAGSGAVSSLGLASIALDPTSIKKDGTRFGFAAHSADMRTATPPTGYEFFEITSNEAGGTARPYLSIVTASPALATVAKTEQNDVSTAVAHDPVKAASSAQEANDTSTAAAKTPNKASTSAIEANDVATAVAKDPAKAVGSIAEQPDTASSRGYTPVRAAASVAEQSDISAATALVIGGARLNAVEQPDTSAAVGRVKAQASGSAAEAPDLAASVARLIAKALAAVEEQNDTSLATAAGPPRGYAAIVEADDLSTGTGRLLGRAMADGFEADDILLATGHVSVLTPAERILSLAAIGISARNLALQGGRVADRTLHLVKG